MPERESHKLSKKRVVSMHHDPLLDHRLEPHDANQLELKLAYLIKPGHQRQRYLVETYMFIPRTLGIDRNSYNASRFYAHTAAFLRYKTPSVPLSSLGNSHQAQLWFAQVNKGLDGRHTKAVKASQTVRHIKLLGCIYRSAIRDTSAKLVNSIHRLPEDESEVCARLTQFINNLQDALERLRMLGNRCETTDVAISIKDAWLAVDEYTALIAENSCTDIVEALDSREQGQDNFPLTLEKLREKLAVQAIQAFRYRKQRNYQSYVSEEEENELFPYWRRVLKRIVYSALYLNVRHEEVGKLAKNLVAMTSAALAMLFAASMGLWAQLAWGNFSTTFIVIMVISYMIKDRIKELGKQFLGQRFLRWIPDTATAVYGNSKKRVIGKCRESFLILEPKQVDESIMKVRHSQKNSLAEDGRPETVIKYTKEITLFSKPLQSEMEGLEGLNDIIRFNLGYLRERMDAPLENYQLIHPRTHKIITVPCARVYHLNLVLRLTVGQGEEREVRVERIRVVLNQHGIKRVEFFDPKNLEVIAGAMVEEPFTRAPRVVSKVIPQHSQVNPNDLGTREANIA